ncbi:MAG TPA: HlyD family efflux transporter periplasmic adaptor subunit [Aliidongia sp.]|nr:HlyD family efflux transporter periplasmic adaptor subunit [Aliidongia sp.]
MAVALNAAPAGTGTEAPAGGVAPMGPVALPPLREDLKLLPGAAAADGSPTWTLQDAARHRFIRIGWLEFEILARWGLGKSDAVAEAICAETTIRATQADVLEVLRFVHRAGLLMPFGDAGIKRLVAEIDSQKLSASRWLLKNYLFLKIRLVNPDRALGLAMPYIGWMFTRGFAMALAALALLGFYLISRQWEAYTHSLLHLFSLEGAFEVGVALSAAKVVHELGHGLMSKRFGCRVPAMGVALLVMWPVLWTDTNDAWRLTDRRKRLAIDAAGMLAEITLAVAASLAWSVLPDGPVRTGAFLLSSSTWVLTVLVNVNPLMRFDGYFLLSDLIDVPNLQERGFAIGRWWLREQLFGLEAPPPENFPPAKRRILIAYSLSALIYRFSLFLGIALVVYHMAFKALGFFLMAVEIWWFLARPILGELFIWKGSLTKVRRNRRLTTTILLAGLGLLLLVLPWRSQVAAPALLRAEHQAILYTAEPGQLARLPRNGDRFAEGDAVFGLQSPTVAFHKATAAAVLAGIEARMKGQAFDPDAASSLEVGWQELQGAVATLDQAKAQEAVLTVRAPFAGIVTDVPPSLRAAQWLPRREALGMLVDPSSAVVEAYVGEADLARVHAGAEAKFYPDNGDDPVALTVTSVNTASLRALDAMDLASVYGGGIAVRKDAAGKLEPESALYRALLAPTQPGLTVPKRLRGTVEIAGDRTSLIARIYRRAVAVVIREGGL